MAGLFSNPFSVTGFNPSAPPPPQPKGLLGGISRGVNAIGGLLGGVNSAAMAIANPWAYQQMQIGRENKARTIAALEEENKRREEEAKRKLAQEAADAARKSQIEAELRPLIDAGDYEGASRVYARYMMPTEAKAVRDLGINGISENSPYGKINPGDYDPASLAEFDAAIAAGKPKAEAFRLLRRTWAPPQPATMIIGGVPSIVNKGSGSVTPLSSYDAEVAARAGMAGAEQDAKTRATESVQWEAGAPQREAKARSTQASAGNVRNTVQSALGKVDSMSTGFAGARLAKIEGTKAYDLNQQLTTIKANLGFDRLQQMRDQSPTGGALGQVAVQELQALQAAVASLDIGQSDQQLRANLQAIDKHYANWQAAVEKSRQQSNPVQRGASKPRITSDAEYDALPSGAEFIDPEGNPRRKP